MNEPLDRNIISEQRIKELSEQYAGEILGLKVRISKNIVGKEGIMPLDHALELGERLGRALSPGDVVCPHDRSACLRIRDCEKAQTGRHLQPHVPQ